jgi:hypothetical protein
VPRLLIALLMILPLTGCDFRGQGSEREAATTVRPAPTAPTESLPAASSPTERLIAGIRACEVRRIFFAGDSTYITFRGGEKVRLTTPIPMNVVRAAYGRAKCNILIGFAE